MTLNPMTKTLLAATLIAIAGCSSSSSDQRGTLSLSIMDGPIEEAEAVVVEFSAITLKPAGGNEIVIELPQAKSIDLLQQQNGATASLLDDVELDSGRYNWIRLSINAKPNVDDTYITVAGVKHELDIPSGAQSGLKLVRGFNVNDGGHSNFTIDFELRKSIVHNAQGYKLKPALRLIDNVQAGHIGGEVDPTVLSSNNCGSNEQVAASVYVFAGHSVTPDDVGSANPPVATSNVIYSATEQKYRYKVAFLDAGDYTVSLTCEAGLDDAEADDNISFINSQNATVSANNTQTINF